jgi:hypothetical protein
MPEPRFCTRASRRRADSAGMDVIAIVIGVAFFAAMVLFIEGLDRV